MLQHSNKKIVRVLQVLGGLKRGGAETFVMNLYRGLNREEIQFDFVIHTTEKGDFYDEIKPHLRQMFKDKEVHKDFNEEEECMLAKPEILQTIATIYRKKVLNFYQDLMRKKSSNKFNKGSQLERMKESIRTQLLWNQYLDKLPNNKYQICGAWLYEYEVFNILYLMKVFNPKKQVLIWRGW